MKKYEIAALSESEMKERINEAQKLIAEIVFKKATEPPQNTSEVRNLRKDIARMKTALNKKKLAIEAEKTK
ncbi:MAG: 50S ribosomal protein L29 [Chloroherpetonaceae bacterium]|nr:50S ribosomal protein L29 [Chloroherpetonaceae bacterium]